MEAHLQRVARSSGFLLLSASAAQVARQPPLQSVALLLEPPQLYLCE